MFIIGIDGGGTKTKGVLVHESGKVIASAIVGASNPNLVGQSDLLNTFNLLFDQLKKQNKDAFWQVTRVFAGMSGAGHPNVRHQLKSIIISLLPKKMRVTIVHDAIIALYSGTLGHPGIVQIAGTGSITYGMNHKGIQGRVGGWGHLLGESGSGYSLGSDALHAVFNAYDGLGEKTILHEMILDYFKVGKLPDIVHKIYHTTNQKEEIAALSKLVVQAAQCKDYVSQQIIMKNGTYIGEAITCLARQLFSETKEISVVLTGGLFKRLDLLQTSIETVLQKRNIQANLIRPKIDPVGGAVIAAMKKENKEITDDFPIVFANHLKIRNIKGD